MGNSRWHLEFDRFGQHLVGPYLFTILQNPDQGHRRRRHHQHRADGGRQDGDDGEDRAYAFTADDFGFADADAGDTLASVTIVTPPARARWRSTARRSWRTTSSPRPRSTETCSPFTPARDAHGDPYTTFTFTVNDGTDDSASAYTMTIDVTTPPSPSAGARYRRRRPAPDLDRHGDGGSVRPFGNSYCLRIRSW